MPPGSHTILHVLTGTIFDGTMTYTTTLADHQLKQGNRVIIVGNRLPVETRAQFFSIPINKRSIIYRVLNVIALVRLIRREGVDLVHAHSRAASWLCHFATKFTKTAYVSTIHAHMLIHASSKKHNVYGSHVIAVCEDIREHALRETDYFEPEQIRVIYNGIAL